MCVCVKERQRKRMREMEREIQGHREADRAIGNYPDLGPEFFF